MNASVIKIEAGTFQWNDGLLPGGRTPRLWLLAKDGQIHTFKGASIDRVCSVVSEKFAKNGKWSNTDYVIRVGTAVPISLCAPLHGKVFSENFWADVEASFQEIIQGAAPIDWAAFREAVKRDYPATAQRLDGAEAAPELE